VPRASAATAERLRDLILDGAIEPGAEVRQEELARELGVSRTPLREALRLLEGEGLVEARPHRSIVVSPLSASEIEEVYAMRVLLEATAIRVTVPSMGTSELAHLRGLLAEMNFHAGRRDARGWEGPHERFHATLVAGVQGSYRRQLVGLARASRRYRRAHLGSQPYAWERGAAEHERIADACESGDADAAAAALAAHLAQTALGLIADSEPEVHPALLLSALDAVPGAGRAVDGLLGTVAT
jgi:DNA-binding GntR family transcriptional regulator